MMIEEFIGVTGTTTTTTIITTTKTATTTTKTKTTVTCFLVEHKIFHFQFRFYETCPRFRLYLMVQLLNESIRH